MEPSLQNVLDQKSLKWVFVGGKGGVGKTTTSCGLAIQLSKVRKNVLLISTDPAHNLSDAFGQKFGKDATLVNGFKNLYAMEVDPLASMEEMKSENGDGASSPFASITNELSMTIPGIDEAMSFAQVMKLIQSMEFDVVVFDTAPTGHTLRFLSFPVMLEKALGKITELGSKYGGLLKTLPGMFGQNASSFDPDAIMSKLRDLSAVVSQVNEQFTDADRTTFVAVAIAEFLSLYETERMIQELTGFHIDIHNIVVNQLLFPGANAIAPCDHCNARSGIQHKYLEQMYELYGEDFHIVKLPLLPREVRGAKSLEEFSQLLLHPFNPDQ